MEGQTYTVSFLVESSLGNRCPFLEVHQIMAFTLCYSTSLSKTTGCFGRINVLHCFLVNCVQSPLSGFLIIDNSFFSFEEVY